MAGQQHSWGGPDGQYTPPNRTPIFTTTTVTYYTPVAIPNTSTTLTPPLSITTRATTTDTATTTFFQTSTTTATTNPSVVTITVTIFRPFPAPTNSGTPTGTGASSFRNNRTHWGDWSPGHRAGLVVGVLAGVIAAALVLLCMARRCRMEKRDPESGGLWGRNAESDDDSDTEGVAAAAASGGINRFFAAGMLGVGGNKKYREGKGLKRDGIGRAHKVDIHRISDPVFLHSSRGGIEDIVGTDQRPAGAALPPQRSGRPDWPLPIEQGEASGAATAPAQRRVYSRCEQGSSESPGVRVVNYKPLPAEEMTEDEEEVSRGIAKGGRRLQRRMRC